MASTLDPSTREFLNISRCHLLSSAGSMAANEHLPDGSACISVPWVSDEEAESTVHAQAAPWQRLMTSQPQSASSQGISWCR